MMKLMIEIKIEPELGLGMLEELVAVLMRQLRLELEVRPEAERKEQSLGICSCLFI